MDISEVLFSALFCFSMVFGLLGGLYILVRVCTNIIRFVEAKVKK